MSDPFDGYLYLKHLRARWSIPAVIVGAALIGATVFTFAQTPQYTAKVALVIDPPAASDPRVATAVSPIYLESLRTYEHFAASDHLFAQAVEKFDLRAGEQGTIEGLKRQVLDVAIPKNTKVLEIHATLADPRKAHALASYIANHTIELNRKTSRAGDQEFIEHTSRELKAATERAAAAETAYTSALKNAPMPEATQSELHRLGERRAEVARLALSAELSVADLQDRAKALAAAGRSGTEELELLNERIRSTGNRAQTLRAELRSLDDQVRQREKLLAGRKASVDVLAAEYEAARSIREEAAKRLRDAQASAEYRGERINLLDPGIVPERPSSPNLPLNLTVAVALGLLVSLAYLTIEFVMQSQQVEVARKLPRVVGKS